MKKHVVILCSLLQASLILSVTPQLDEAAFNFVRDLTTGSDINLDQVTPEVIEQIGSLVDSCFSLEVYEAKKENEILDYLFNFGEIKDRMFIYDSKPYYLQLEQDSKSRKKYIHLLDDKSKPIPPNPEGPASHLYIMPPTDIDQAGESAHKPSAHSEKDRPAPKFKLCASFCKALCAATITSAVVYYAVGLYNKNKEKAQQYSQKKWALGAATIVGLGTFACLYVNNTTTQ